MGALNWIIVNKYYYQENEPVFQSTNRSLKYGDGLFETIRLIDGKLFCFENHWERLMKGISFLGIKYDSSFNSDVIHNQIIELCSRNFILKGGRIRLTVFRNEGGLYTPENNSLSYIIEANELIDNKFVLNKKGLLIDIYKDIRKPFNKLSSIKSNSSLIYVLASLFRKENNLDDCILLNDEGNISEATNSNVFMVSNNKIYTPCIDQACIPGTMRTHVIELIKESGLTVYECSLSQDDLFDASEIFLTNAITGIRWVGGFRQKRYYNSLASRLIVKLNEKAKILNLSSDQLGS